MKRWMLQASIEGLKKFPNLRRQIYDAPLPQGARFQATAAGEGLVKPKK